MSFSFSIEVVLLEHPFEFHLGIQGFSFPIDLILLASTFDLDMSVQII